MDHSTDIPLGPELTRYSIEQIEQAYQGRIQPEAIRMYLAIIKGSLLGGTSGWFGPALTRYSWSWLAERHGVPTAGVIHAEQFRGSALAFSRLDRNRDGMITAEDLDWSDGNPWVQYAAMANRLFRKIDTNGDGALSRHDWCSFFDSVACGQDSVTSEELRDAWLAGISSGFLPGDTPTQEMLIRGLLDGELGSVSDGPQLNEPAPDFQLTTHDGSKILQLSDIMGSKPIVLVFGNFTCAPFRSMYPAADAVARRFRNDAIFLGIYVREAHPTDGWKMVSNANVGVEVRQPRTYGERTTVAQSCHRLLNPTIPLLVDEIDDKTGHAYSGMPARLYVIDRQGKVAYKSGRGPFGFKVGEMEQALIMNLLDD